MSTQEYLRNFDASLHQGVQAYIDKLSLLVQQDIPTNDARLFPIQSQLLANCISFQRELIPIMNAYFLHVQLFMTAQTQIQKPLFMTEITEFHQQIHVLQVKCRHVYDIQIALLQHTQQLKNAIYATQAKSNEKRDKKDQIILDTMQSFIELVKNCIGFLGLTEGQFHHIQKLRRMLDYAELFEENYYFLTKCHMEEINIRSRGFIITTTNLKGNFEGLQTVFKNLEVLVLKHALEKKSDDLLKLLKSMPQHIASFVQFMLKIDNGFVEIEKSQNIVKLPVELNNIVVKCYEYRHRLQNYSSFVEHKMLPTAEALVNEVMSSLEIDIEYNFEEWVANHQKMQKRVKMFEKKYKKEMETIEGHLKVVQLLRDGVQEYQRKITEGCDVSISETMSEWVSNFLTPIWASNDKEEKPQSSNDHIISSTKRNAANVFQYFVPALNCVVALLKSYQTYVEISLIHFGLFQTKEELHKLALVHFTLVKGFANEIIVFGADFLDRTEWVKNEMAKLYFPASPNDS